MRASNSQLANDTLLTATMSANSLDLLASGGKARNTRTLLRVVILCFIAAAAIASRLFSVIRKYHRQQLFPSSM